MIEVLPAIIPMSWEQLEEEMRKVSFAPKVQVDISDGIFSPTKTWPYINGEFFQKLKNQEIGWPPYYPQGEKIEVELHLMVKDPENVLQDWIATGVAGIVCHIEATQNFQKIIETCRENNIAIGVALKPSTDASLIENLEADFIQVMGSDTIGRHGVKLENIAVEKIKSLRSRYPERIIAIDIGVAEDTAETLITAGANKLISGSAILNAPNPKEVYDYLCNLSPTKK